MNKEYIAPQIQICIIKMDMCTMFAHSMIKTSDKPIMNSEDILTKQRSFWGGEDASETKW